MTTHAIKGEHRVAFVTVSLTLRACGIASSDHCSLYWKDCWHISSSGSPSLNHGLHDLVFIDSDISDSGSIDDEERLEITGGQCETPITEQRPLPPPALAFSFSHHDDDSRSGISAIKSVQGRNNPPSIQVSKSSLVCARLLFVKNEMSIVGILIDDGSVMIKFGRNAVGYFCSACETCSSAF